MAEKQKKNPKPLPQLIKEEAPKEHGEKAAAAGGGGGGLLTKLPCFWAG